MAERTVAPYGSWASPFAIDRLTEGVVFISEVRGAGGVRWWLEGRPDESGRQILFRRDPDGSMTRLTPEGFNARCRVHEYGGAATLVSGDLVVVSDFTTGRLHRVTAPEELVAAHARSRLALRRLRPRRAPRTPLCRPRGPRTGRRGGARGVGQRAGDDRPVDRRGRGRRFGRRFLRRAAALARRATAVLARVEPPEPALGRHGAQARRDRRGRCGRPGHDDRRQRH